MITSCETVFSEKYINTIIVSLYLSLSTYIIIMYPGYRGKISCYSLDMFVSRLHTLNILWIRLVPNLPRITTVLLLVNAI